MGQRPSEPNDLIRWTAVDRYLEGALRTDDPALESALSASRSAGLPEIQISPLQGRYLHLLARAIRAQGILEIGTLGGYSTIWLARALPAGGRLVSLELDPDHVKVALANLANAGVADRVEVQPGPALGSLEKLAVGGLGPFDLVFIDADKPNVSAYIDWAIRLSHPGSLIIVDNVVRRGDVLDEQSRDPNVRGVREMLERLRRDDRVLSAAVQTVGVKGHDGWLVALVGPPDAPSRSGGPSAVPRRRARRGRGVSGAARI